MHSVRVLEVFSVPTLSIAKELQGYDHLTLPKGMVTLKELLRYYNCIRITYILRSVDEKLLAWTVPVVLICISTVFSTIVCSLNCK